MLVQNGKINEEEKQGHSKPLLHKTEKKLSTVTLPPSFRISECSLHNHVSLFVIVFFSNVEKDGKEGHLCWGFDENETQIILNKLLLLFWAEGG